MFKKRKPKFLIRVLYKSGNHMDFWVHSFSIKGSNYSWETVAGEAKPVLLGVDNVEAVYQLKAVGG